MTRSTSGWAFGPRRIARGLVRPAARLVLRSAARGYVPHGVKPMLILPEPEVSRPRFPAINAHAHLRGPFGGRWASRTADELVAAMDECGQAAMVSLDGGFGRELVDEICRLQMPQPRRLAVFANLDYSSFQHDGFASEAQRLRESAAVGARGLKVWKNLGLSLRDASGRLIGLHDQRLTPIWEAAAHATIPVLIHFADPRAFFQPMTPDNERWFELRRHPDWHRYPSRPVGDAMDPRPPSYEELHEQFERLIGGNPSTTFIGAHMASSSEDLGRLAGLLDRYPNLYVDISATLNELGRQPYTSRDFLIRFQDRVVFGTDGGPDPAISSLYYRYLETRAEYVSYAPDDRQLQGSWRIYGVDLPEDVLRKIYRDNVLSLVQFDR